MNSSLNGHIKFAFFTAITLVAAFALAWVWYGWLDDQGTSGSNEVAESGLAGTLLLTYASVNKETDSATLLPALLDLSSGEAVYLNNSSNGSVLTGLDYALSPDKKWLVFVDQNPRYPSDSGVSDSAIYRSEWFGENLTQAFEKVAAVTDPQVMAVNATKPAVSDNGSILYMSSPIVKPLEASADLMAWNWDITVSDQEGNERLLTKGSEPHWLDDDTFLFLKNDGIYRYSLTDGTETHLVTTLTTAIFAHKLVLDPGHGRALLIDPAASAVRLFDIDTTGGDVALKERQPIMVSATSAAFSPDGQYVALTLLPADTNETSTILAVYDLNGEQVYQTILSETSFAYTTLQAWLR